MRTMMRSDALERHAESMHAGFAHVDQGFLADRKGRAALVRRFLGIMAEAGNPGLEHSLGITAVRQATGQPEEAYWSTVLTDSHGHHRTFVVSADGGHGWGDEIGYSDRPRSGADEVSPQLVRRALNAILARYQLNWESPVRLPTTRGPSIATRKGAAISASQELRRREVRYGLLMIVRVLFLLVAAALVMFDVNNARWWILGCIAGALIVPWVAVMVANEQFPHRRGGFDTT